MKAAILTGGGDCPGLNAVIRAVVRTIHNAGGESIGLLEGWRGAIEGIQHPLHAEIQKISLCFLPRDQENIRVYQSFTNLLLEN